MRLGELSGYELICFEQEDSLLGLAEKVQRADAVVHLAGVNRPKDVCEFSAGNIDLTIRLCNEIAAAKRQIPLILSSSIQAELANPYGVSKQGAERAVADLAHKTGNPVVIYRLPNVFGKWCRPNYNSVVATFCHNIANDLPIQINDPDVQLRLVYIDDVVTGFIDALNSVPIGLNQRKLKPEYNITLGALAKQIGAFKNCRASLLLERVGAGLVRALYATYMSYLSPEKFTYDLPQYADERGVFVEMLKTTDSGQFSFFTALPGITRGGHYHHTKTEKFLVIKGLARFNFRQLLTGERHELFTSGENPKVVETIPGWAHDITNVGGQELVVMLWANEIFDRARPDTIIAKA